MMYSEYNISFLNRLVTGLSHPPAFANLRPQLAFTLQHHARRTALTYTKLTDSRLARSHLALVHSALRCGKIVNVLQEPYPGEAAARVEEAD